MYNNILTYVDLNKEISYQKSLPIAVEFAKKFNAELNILTTVPSFGMPIVEQFFPDGFDEAEVRNAILKNLEAFIDKNVPDEIESRAILGKNEPHRSMLSACEKLGIDLIIIPAILSKHHMYNFGTTATAVARYSNVSVLIVK